MKPDSSPPVTVNVRPDKAPEGETVVLEGGDAARLIELCYWSNEPGLLDVIRALVAMRSEARAALLSFLSTQSDPRHIAVAPGKPRELTLFYSGQEDSQAPQQAKSLKTRV